jgi:poly(beta-D-mannuronate) lyase
MLPAAPGPVRAAPPLPLEEYRVARKGEVLFEREARAAALAALSAADRRAWCGPTVERWRSHKAVTKIRTPDDEDIRTDDRSEPFAWTVMNAAAAAFGLDDGEARRALIGNLRRWAKGKALTKLQDHHENTYYAFERTLLPTIVAYSLLRPHADLEEDERKLIERWLNRLVRLRGIKRPEESHGEISVQNNHRYLRDAVDMAWGTYRGNDELFRKGIESYLLALGQMRVDGSLPLETERGARALWYQRHAIASLVAIAEMAAVQGYDLYAVEVNGRTLHDAVDFLARAVDEPDLVWAYAAANVRPGQFDNYQVQDLAFMARRGHGRHYMAWLEAYRARFPERAAARRLWRLIAEFDRAPRPMIDEYSGGNTTCFFAVLG